MHNSHRTAIKRLDLTAPARWLKSKRLIQSRSLDYGCGRSRDAELLKIERYDPHFYPDKPDSRQKFKTILCTYVLNTIPDEEERLEIIEDIKSYLCDDGKAYITVRNDRVQLRGWTKRGTWQGLIRLPYRAIYRTSGYTIYEVTK